MLQLHSDDFSVDADEAYDFDHSAMDKNRRWNPTNSGKLTTKNVVSFIQKAQPNPGGAAIFALATYGVPPFNPIGAAYMVRHMPAPLEGAVPYTLQDSVLTGLGGLQAGQNISQPLYDAQSNTVGGVVQPLSPALEPVQNSLEDEYA